jgi:ribosomal-protein-alanine N-acetyltransferase
MSAVVQEPLLNFRPMLEDDLGRVLQIECSAYEFPWSRRIFQDCLRVGYCCWVLEQGASVAGYGIMAVASGESHVLNLCIAPEWQSSGRGRILLDFLMDVARKHKADTAFLEVRPSNRAAIQLYQGAGFDEVGMRRNYYPARGGREDAIIMARTLLQERS